MKKLSFSLLLMLGFFATLFISCDEEDDGPDIAPPVFTDSPDNMTVEVGSTTTLTYTATTPGGYQSSSVASSDDAIATATITSEPSSSTDSQGTFEVTVTAVAAGEATITLTVTDNEAQSANNDVVINVEEMVGGVQNIGDTIPDIEALSTLATALEATDLDETLNGEGPFTVFAPNNDAFTALLEALELDDLPAVIEALGEDGVSQLLQAHVVGGESLGSGDLSDGMELTTVNDSMITITTDGTNVFANGAQVVTADIVAGNGVIHIIDSVINLPPVDEEMADAGTALSMVENLDSLYKSVEAVELTDDLDDAEQVTIFAPNNAAFEALLAEQGVDDLAGLIDALTAEGVAGVLQAHVVAESLDAAAVVAAAGGDSLATLNADKKLGITMDGDMVYVNGAQVLETDIMANNGVIHVIDSVVNLP